MAACGSLQRIFDKPLPESPTLIESLSSWKQKSKSLKPIDDSSFTEIFGELHFKENNIVTSSSSSSSSSSLASSAFSSCLPPSSSASSSVSSSSSFFLDAIHQSEIEALENKDNKNDRNKSPVSSYYPVTGNKKHDRHSESFSSRTSDTLSMCTEGLGFESSDDIEDLMKELNLKQQQQQQQQREEGRRRLLLPRLENQVINHDYSKRSRTHKGSFPPPISCIGRSGKPWVCFKSFREDGRFILKEIRIPTQEFLHACREDGRLMMHVIHSDDEILDEEDDFDEEIEEEDDDDDSFDVEEEDDVGHDNM